MANSIEHNSSKKNSNFGSKPSSGSGPGFGSGPGLRFKPITDGLGFHPFSNGLPYQENKNASRSKPEPMEWVQDLRGPAKPESPSFSPKVVVTPQERGLIYLMRRMFAFGLDFVLLSAICLGGFWVLLNRQGVGVDFLMSQGAAPVAVLFVAVFNWCLITAQEVTIGTTLGKRLFGLRLDAPAPVIFLRAILFVPSLSVGFLGMLWAAFDREGRCWHDIMTDVQPIED